MLFFNAEVEGEDHAPFDTTVAFAQGETEKQVRIASMTISL
jgi:hypothetical protein